MKGNIDPSDCESDPNAFCIAIIVIIVLAMPALDKCVSSPREHVECPPAIEDAGRKSTAMSYEDFKKVYGFH